MTMPAPPPVVSTARFVVCMAIICAIIAWLGYDLATIPLAATQFEAVGAIAYGVFKMTCAVVGVVGVLLFMSGKPYRMR